MAASSTDPLSQDDAFGRILEESLNEIYLFDADTLKFLRVNRGARENLGYSMDELSRLTPLDLKPDFSAEDFERLAGPLRSGTRSKIRFEARHQRKDGTRYDVEVHLQLMPLRGASAFVAIILDVTDRNRAAADLRVRNHAIDSATVGIVITDPLAEDNPIVYCNRAFERITGYSAAEVVGRNCRLLQANDRNQPAIEEIRDAVYAGRRCRAVLRNYRKDGSAFWNELTVTPVRGLDGQITNFIGEVNDVTSQREAEEHIQTNEARLAAILNKTVEAIITIDQHGVCESANRAAEAMFGYPAEELIGQNVSLLMPSPHREAHNGYLANYLLTGKKKIIGIGREVVGRRRDGSEFPVHLSVSEVMLGSRRIFTGILQDLSEQKEYQRRLIQSERLAAVGEAMASVAHESRNLLQKIQISVELGRLQAAGNGALAGQLDNIESASDGLHALLEEVRDYAAPLKLTLAPHAIGELIDQAWRLASQAHADKQATLRVTDDTGARLRVDGFRLTQVFRNLLENSLAAGDEPIEVSVDVTETHTAGERMLCVLVRDNGPGLNSEQRARVFEPFFTTKSKGTGLGMSIAQKIVHAHGGRMSVEGAGAAGAEFQIHLPL